MASIKVKLPKTSEGLFDAIASCGNGLRAAIQGGTAAVRAVKRVARSGQDVARDVRRARTRTTVDAEKGSVDVDLDGDDEGTGEDE
jgi:hypothetical protein